MSACNTFTEHVWKPGECKNCFKPKSLHLASGASVNANIAHSNTQRGGGSSRSGQFRPPVAKKPTIAVKPTMMLPCPGMEGAEPGKTSAFTVWNHNGLNRKRPAGPNNNEGDDERGEIEGYASLCPPSSSSNNNNGLTDVLKEIAGLGQGPSSSREDFFGRITCSYRRSLERGLPAAGCLAMGSHSSSGGAKHVSLSDSAEVISSEGGRFCYPEFSSDGEDDDDGAEGSDEDEDDDDDEHESWDESDEELLAMEIRMRGQPRFANFRAATLSPVPFAVGKKWNTVPLRNRSLQRICAVDYDDSYDEILNGYPSVDSNGAPGLLSYGSDPQGSGFLSNSVSTTSPESSSSLPEDSCTSSSGSSAPFGQRNGLHLAPVGREHTQQGDSAGRALSSPKATETHKAVLAIRLQEQDASQKEGGALPQALPGQPITISFSPTEEQAKPYRVVSLEKTPICKPYTVVDVSASMASTEDRPSEISPFTPMSPSIPVSPSTTAGPTPTSKKPGNIRYQEVWTSSTSPRQKIPKVEFPSGGPSGPSIPPRHSNHKSAPTSPVTGLSSSRTVPVKSPNLSEIKFNSYNNAGMPPFPIIIRDEPAYARSSKNAVKVPIVINPSAYDNLAVYKSFLGLSGELPQPKPGAGGRVTSHTYEEIGSSESTQPSPTEHMPSTRKLASTEEERSTPRAVDTPHDDKAKISTESNVAASNFSVTFSTPRVTATPTASPLSGSLTKSSSATASISRSRNPSGEPPAGSSECQSSSVSGSQGHREKASMVLSQIVAAIQPPKSPPDSPTPQSKTCSAEELYSLPPDATKGTLSRPKSLHCPADSGLSKSRKETPTKILPKSQSASAAEVPTSPKPEAGAPYPPPRSTSSPYHATNLLQRHFNNWTRPTGSRPSDGEISLGAEGRRSAEGNKPKRWISFKSFFRRRKDEDEQKEKAEREKEKGKLVGLDGTVITMLPPPPIQRQHWFSESKTDDPNQKPTIIFTYKPDSGAGGDGEGELRVEECNASTAINYNQSGAPKSRASLLISKVMR
uniref:Pseudopodium-enriched atypical kinase 1 n=1 Tax=Astyanax mexicanus TaxID=7994 RepID=A0A8B9JBK7_ASTMX